MPIKKELQKEVLQFILENKIKTFYDALNWSLPNTEPVDESYF